MIRGSTSWFLVKCHGELKYFESLGEYLRTGSNSFKVLMIAQKSLLFTLPPHSAHYGAMDDECGCIILSDGNDLVNVCVWLLAVF